MGPHGILAPPTAMPEPNASGNPKETTRLRRVATEFEGIMLGQITKNLLPSAEDEPADDGGTTANSGLTEQLWGDQMADVLAKSGGLGMADWLAGTMCPKYSHHSTTLDHAIETARSLRQPKETLPPGPSRASSQFQPSLSPNRDLAAVTRPRRVNPVSPSAVAAKPLVQDNRSVPRSPARQALVRVPPAPATGRRVETGSRTGVRAVPVVLRKPESVNPFNRPGLTTPTFPAAAGPAGLRLFGRDNLDPIIHEASHRHHLDPFLVAAVIRQESGGRQYAVSSVGASGYMQLMPGTFKRFAGKGKNIFDPQENINAGTAYLRFLTDRYAGDVDKILAGYNAGEGNVDRYGGIPPFKETRNFVTSVKRHYQGFVAAAQTDRASSSEVALK